MNQYVIDDLCMPPLGLDATVFEDELLLELKCALYSSCLDACAARLSSFLSALCTELMHAKVNHCVMQHYITSTCLGLTRAALPKASLASSTLPNAHKAQPRSQ